MISYGGVYLIPPPGHLRAWLDANLALPDRLQDFAHLDAAGPQLAALGTPAVARDLPPRLGTLRWPVGAANWATAYAVCDDKQLNQIRQQAYAGGGLLALPFWLGDGTRSLTVNLFMLPPRRLSAPDGNPLWLLTLVDQRYFWWQNAAALTVTEGTTTWAQLYAAIGSALGVTISADPVAPAYMTPPAAFAAKYDSLPLLLDAAAAAVGQRLVVGLDGTVRALNVVSAQALLTANLTAASPILAGGKFRLSTADNPYDLPALVPSNFSVVFPAASGGAYSGAWHAEAVTLASLALSDFLGVSGNGRTQVLRALQPVAASGSQITAWAQQAATDWLRWRVAGVAASFAGVCPWAPDGIHALEFDHTATQLITRVGRAPWNDWTAPPALPAAAGGAALPVRYDDATGGDSACNDLRFNKKNFTLTTPAVHEVVVAPKFARAQLFLSSVSAGAFELAPATVAAGGSAVVYPAGDNLNDAGVASDPDGLVALSAAVGDGTFRVRLQNGTLFLVWGNVQASFGGNLTGTTNEYVSVGMGTGGVGQSARWNAYGQLGVLFGGGTYSAPPTFYDTSIDLSFSVGNGTDKVMTFSGYYLDVLRLL